MNVVVDGLNPTAQQSNGKMTLLSKKQGQFWDSYITPACMTACLLLLAAHTSSAVLPRCQSRLVATYWLRFSVFDMPCESLVTLSKVCLGCMFHCNGRDKRAINKQDHISCYKVTEDEAVPEAVYD